MVPLAECMKTEFGLDSDGHSSGAELPSFHELDYDFESLRAVPEPEPLATSRRIAHATTLSRQQELREVVDLFTWEGGRSLHVPSSPPTSSSSVDSTTSNELFGSPRCQLSAPVIDLRGPSPMITMNQPASPWITIALSGQPGKRTFRTQCKSNLVSTGVPELHHQESKDKRTAGVQATVASIEAASSGDKLECHICLRKFPAKDFKAYIRCRKACKDCRSAVSVKKAGKDMRFCQLCSWFHELSAFDSKRRSCRSSLLRHNTRRKAKNAAAAAAAGVVS